VIKVPNNPMQAAFQADLEKAKSASENAKCAMTSAATQMFAFYSNLLSVKVKYLWNKIVEEQMEGSPYVDHQGVSQTGPREMSNKLFDICVLFHLLTMFSINISEQEKYYNTNVLKELQRVNVRQLVRHVEQLNAYILQMLCFSYSPSAITNTKPKNVPFTEEELGSHVLRMCPIQCRTSTLSMRRV
jgi:hypothetical protein